MSGSGTEAENEHTQAGWEKPAMNILRDKGGEYRRGGGEGDRGRRI